MFNRVLRSAARLIGRVSKFDNISANMRDVLHWLPLRQRIEFRVAVLVWYSLIGQPLPTLLTFVAPPLALGAPVTFARLSRASFMSHLLAPPPCRVGPLVWNGLPLALRSLPRVFSQKFLQQLKTTLFGRAGVGSA